MAEPGGEDRVQGEPGPVNALYAFGHLAVLSAFAVSQPLFDLLSDNPEFFAARGSSASEIIVFGLLVTLVPPVLLLAAELLAGLLSPRLRQGLHLTFLALLAAIVFVQALKRSFDTSDVVLIGLALALGALAAAAYERAEPVRSFLSVLTPAPLVFLILFLFISPISKLTISGEAEAKDIEGVRPVPVVMVVFDEFPSLSLMDEKLQIDAQRFPGFAELAKDATWFRGAHSIYDSTSRAVPAIMDGNLPDKDKLPTSGDHPNSIFALLGNSHRLNVSEEATSVCPRDLCRDTRLDEPFVDRLSSTIDDISAVYAHMIAPPGIEADLPNVSETWGDFGGGDNPAGGQAAADQPDTRANLNANRNKRFEAWIASIRRSREPSLNFKHALLPHVPWQYLPDGRQYRRTANDPISDLSRQSYKDANQYDVLQARHLLQAGFADLEVRKLVRHLKRIGLYDDALIVITADHGVAFDVGAFDRRKVNEDNIDEISPIPLFVKRPGQRKGTIDEANVETTDILPTIADVLEIDLSDETDGRSAFSSEVRGREKVRMLKRDLSGWVELSRAAFEALKRAEVAEKVKKFGTGADGPERIYHFGPNENLLGVSVAGVGTGRESDLEASLVGTGEYDDIDTGGTTIPIWIAGRVSGGSGPPHDVAIAVNGTIRAVTSTYRLATGGPELISALVPPSSFVEGRNVVEVYEVVGGRELRPMR